VTIDFHLSLSISWNLFVPDSNGLQLQQKNTKAKYVPDNIFHLRRHAQGILVARQNWSSSCHIPRTTGQK
jgi:hypothetical protein